VRLGYEQGPVVPEIGSTWHVHGFGAYGTARVFELRCSEHGWRVSVAFPKEDESGSRVREFELSEWRKIAKCLDDE